MVCKAGGVVGVVCGGGNLKREAEERVFEVYILGTLIEATNTQNMPNRFLLTLLTGVNMMKSFLL